MRLRNGIKHDQDWLFLNSDCAIEHMDTVRRASFERSDTMSLYTTNEACDNKNRNQLLRLEEPICWIEASHDCHKSSSESCRRLSKTLCVIYGAKVMLLWNIALQLGLVNGSIGTVIDFIYRNSHRAPMLPYAVIINFPDYKGPPCFSGAGREKWVPLRASKFDFEDSDGQHYREQFPIALCWGLTVWKAQGMTVPTGTKLSVVLGDKERCTGITYVAVSRNEDLSDLCIGNGICIARFTTEIAKSEAFKARRCEDGRLQQLQDATRSFYSLS